jgi:hypothetical protein
MLLGYVTKIYLNLFGRVQKAVDLIYHGLANYSFGNPIASPKGNLVKQRYCSYAAVLPKWLWAASP